MVLRRLGHITGSMTIRTWCGRVALVMTGLVTVLIHSDTLLLDTAKPQTGASQSEGISEV